MVLWQRRLRFVAVAAAAVLGAFSAGGGALAQQEVVNIGYTGPLSGGAALYGKNVLSGLEFAADEIEKAGGIEVGGKKYSLKIVALDDKYAPSEAAVNAKRLKGQYNTPIIFVPHSGGAFALQAFNEQDGFIIGAYTSVPNLTERGNKLTVRIPPSFAGYAEPFAKVQVKRFGKSLGMAGADHDYAKAWAQVMTPVWQAAGGKIVAENPMSYNKDTDFYSGVSRVLSASPDVIFVGGASEPTALVIRQARELGFTGGFIAMDQAKLDEMARVLGGYSMLEGTVGTMPLVFDPRPGAKAFVEKIRKQYNKEPGSEIGYNYSSIYAIADAMKRAGTVSDPKAIYAKLDEAFSSLPEERNGMAVAGMDDKGGLKTRFLVANVEGGKIVPVNISELAQK